MVSGIIIPMTARVEILMSSSGVRGGVFMVLLDLGHTRCLFSPEVVEMLGMRLRRLRQPMAFSSWMAP